MILVIAICLLCVIFIRPFINELNNSVEIIFQTSLILIAVGFIRMSFFCLRFAVLWFFPVHQNGAVTILSDLFTLIPMIICFALILLSRFGIISTRLHISKVIELNRVSKKVGVDDSVLTNVFETRVNFLPRKQYFYYFFLGILRFGTTF